MSGPMRRITASRKSLHIEAPGCIVNIRLGLRDLSGRRVTSIEIIPDQQIGEEWTLDGQSQVRVIESCPPADRAES